MGTSVAEGLILFGLGAGFAVWLQDRLARLRAHMKPPESAVYWPSKFGMPALIVAHDLAIGWFTACVENGVWYGAGLKLNGEHRDRASALRAGVRALIAWNTTRPLEDLQNWAALVLDNDAVAEELVADVMMSGGGALDAEEATAHSASEER